MENIKPSVVVKETPAKKARVTVVSYIKALGASGAKDRQELAKKVFDRLTALGIKRNSKGKVINLEHVTSLVSAVIRDINEPRRGWWSTYKVEETDDSVKILPK